MARFAPANSHFGSVAILGDGKSQRETAHPFRPRGGVGMRN